MRKQRASKSVAKRRLQQCVDNYASASAHYQFVGRSIVHDAFRKLDDGSPIRKTKRDDRQHCENNSSLNQTHFSASESDYHKDYRDQ